MSYEVLESQDNNFLIIRFYCKKCGERIKTCIAECFEGNVPTEARIEYEGEIADIARQSNMDVYFDKNGMYFLHKTPFCASDDG